MLTKNVDIFIRNEKAKELKNQEIALGHQRFEIHYNGYKKVSLPIHNGKKLFSSGKRSFKGCLLD